MKPIRAAIAATLLGVLALAGHASAHNDHDDDDDKKVEICHRDQGHPEWKVISISESALPAHLAHQWGGDIYPVPQGGCPVTETTTVPDTTPDTTVPDTTPDTTVPDTTPDTTVPATTPTTVPDTTVDTTPVVPVIVTPTPQVATDIPPVPSSAPLPHTGRSNTGLLMIATVLTLIGSGAMWLSRRKVHA